MCRSHCLGRKASSLLVIPWSLMRTRRPSRADGRGCDGYAGAAWATRGPVVLRPQQTRPGLLEGSLARAPRDLGRSPGLPCGARVAAISVPVRSSACRSALLRRTERLPFSQLAAGGSLPLLALPRQRVSRASWISAFSEATLPGADRLPRWVLDPNAPSQASDMRIRTQPEHPGDNAAPW